MTELKPKLSMTEVIARILFFIPMASILFMAAIILFVRTLWNYVCHGGEMITYTGNLNRKTILDTYLIIKDANKRTVDQSSDLGSEGGVVGIDKNKSTPDTSEEDTTPGALVEAIHPNKVKKRNSPEL